MVKFDQWLNTLASAGVIIGLIFVAVEIRQNTQATISASSEALTTQSLDFLALGIDSEVLAPAIHKLKSGQPLTDFEQDQLQRHQYFNFRIFENAYLQYRRGFYDDTEWSRYQRIIASNLIDNAAARAMWSDTAGYWTVEFEEEVNAIHGRAIKD
jgi:hypothetical protein